MQTNLHADTQVSSNKLTIAKWKIIFRIILSDMLSPEWLPFSFPHFWHSLQAYNSAYILHFDIFFNKQWELFVTSVKWWPSRIPRYVLYLQILTDLLFQSTIMPYKPSRSYSGSRRKAWVIKFKPFGRQKGDHGQRRSMRREWKLGTRMRQLTLSCDRSSWMT